MSFLDVSIVIPSWNGRHLLEKFLPSVIEAARHYASTDRRAVEIIVVDDASTDDTVDWLAAQAAVSPITLRTIRLDRNEGFGAASNRGVRAAVHGLVLLVNNDVEVDREAVAPLVAAFSHQVAGSPLFAVHCRAADFATGQDVGTGKIGRFARGFLRVHRSYIHQVQTPVAPSIFASGGSAMFDRAKFLELDGFDPIFAPFYFEDVELSYRAWKRGLAVAYEPRSLVRHQFSSTIGPLAGRRIPRISHRNRLLLHWIHLHDGVWLVEHLAWVLLLTVTSPLTLKPHLAGALLDALRRLPRALTRRRGERRRAVRTDREVAAIFEVLERSGEVRAYDDPRELG